LTVLVADVVGSTELFGRLGVDRADDARRALFSAFSAAIGAGNGVLIKTMGDGCLASFESAADAVTAAVGVQQAVARIREHKVPGLGVRVGIAVGDVTEEDGDVFGPAVVAADRLCGAAGEHQILATDMVRMLAGDRGGHNYEAVGGLILKGIADPVPACTVRVGAATAGRPFPVALAATAAERLVGRSEELDVLRDAFKAASAGDRRAVLVAGEPGVGKTRLVAAMARRAHDDGALVLFGRCEEDLAVAYQPFADALRAGLAGLDPDVVDAHVAVHGGEVRRLVPTIEAAEPVRAEPALEQARLFDAVTDLLQRAADDRPVVLVLDDLHWAAPSTIALLRHLLGADPSHSLCVFGTYRDTEVDRSHALGGLLTDVHRTDGVERLALRGLDGQGVEDLIAAASGDELADDTRSLAAALAERTDGNPFFANQVLRHLVERAVLVQDGGRWIVSGSLDDVDLPEGVLDVVGRRLSRLSPDANQALAVAALCGLEFGVRVLREVRDAGTPDAVVDGLDEAVRARLLVEIGPGRFAFTHAIVRDTLTRELTIARRARFHRAIGEAILAVYRDAPDVPLAELARHFTEAAVLGDTASAARWATAAARAAADQADHRGAIAVLERALSVIDAVEPVDQPARFDVAVALSERHYAVLETDAVSVGAGADAARRLRSGERMVRVAVARFIRHSGEADPEGIALYEDALQLLDPAAVPLRAIAFAGLAALESMQEIAAFGDNVETANALLPDIDTTAPKVGAYVRLQIANATLGLPCAARRLRLCDEAMAVAPEVEDPWWVQLATGVNVASALHVFRGQSLMALGRRTEFESDLAQLKELGETTGNMLALAVAHARVALLALLDGRFEDVAPNAKRMREAAPEGHFRFSYLSLLGTVALEQGRAADQLSMAEAALAATTDHHATRAWAGRFLFETGDHRRAAEVLDHLIGGWTGWARNMNWPLTLAETAEIAVGLGAIEHAERIAEELEPYAGELVVTGIGILCLGAFDRYRGMVLGLLGRHDEAVAALTAALTLEESIESPVLTARTRYWLARALLQRDERGDRERAAAELGRSIRTADLLGMAGIARAGRELATDA
jgi:class 3 adenylate cyclase/tetratricopeptide (TPR) repeat protein